MIIVAYLKRYAFEHLVAWRKWVRELDVLKSDRAAVVLGALVAVVICLSYGRLKLLKPEVVVRRLACLCEACVHVLLGRQESRFVETVSGDCN